MTTLRTAAWETSMYIHFFFASWNGFALHCNFVQEMLLGATWQACEEEATTGNTSAHAGYNMACSSCSVGSGAKTSLLSLEL